METINIELVVLCLVIGYGLILGIGNMTYRIGSILGLGTYNQSCLGQILDMVWVSCIIWLLVIKEIIPLGEFV